MRPIIHVQPTSCWTILRAAEAFATFKQAVKSELNVTDRIQRLLLKMIVHCRCTAMADTIPGSPVSAGGSRSQMESMLSPSPCKSSGNSAESCQGSKYWLLIQLLLGLTEDIVLMHAVAGAVACASGPMLRALRIKEILQARSLHQLLRTPSFFVNRKICTARAPQQASKHFRESETARLGPMVYLHPRIRCVGLRSGFQKLPDRLRTASP